MRRNISQSLRRELERQESAEVLLVFAEISNPVLAEPIRVVSDAKDYLWRGQRFIGFWFDAVLMSDTEGPPEARLAVQNVDQQIGEAIRLAKEACRLDLYVIPASEFDETQDPRVAKGLSEDPPVDAVPEYGMKHTYLIETEVDVEEVRATVASYNYSQRMWGRRVTKSAFPAIFA